MARTHFEKLRVYLLAEKLSDAVWAIVRHWPEFDRKTVGSQLVRAADSIGANIAEGSGRGTFADNGRFVRMARGSLYECQHWLRRAWRRNLLKPEEVTSLKAIVDELGPKLNAFLSSISRTENKHRKQSPPGNTPPTPESGD